MKKIFFLFILSFYSAFVFCGQNTADSLKNVLRSSANDTNKARTLNRLSELLWRRGDYDEGKKYALDAVAMFNDSLFSKGDQKWRRGMLASSYTNLGIISYREGDYAFALKNYSLALKLRQENNDLPAISVTLVNFGVVYRNQGDYPKALEYYFKALRIAEEQKDKKPLAGLYGNIGNVYGSQSEFKKALEYYFKALAIGEELKDKRTITTNLGNIGLVYMNQPDYPKALEYFFKGLKMAGEVHDKKAAALDNGNIGVTYRDMGNYTEALNYGSIALKMNEEMKNKNGIASQLNNIGAVYLKQKKFADARNYFNRSSKIAKEIGAKEWIQDNFRYLTWVDSAEGDYHSSFDDYKMYIIYRDSLENEETTKRSVRTAMQYEFDKKTTADSIKNAEQVKQENLKHEQEIRQQKIYTYGGVVGFVLMLIIAGISFRAYRQKQSANALISLQKTLVEEKQKEILDSIHYAKRIQRSLLPTEKYIEKNFRRLKKGWPLH